MLTPAQTVFLFDAGKRILPPRPLAAATFRFAECGYG